MVLALALAFTLASCGAPEETEEQIAARELDSQVWSIVTTAYDQLAALADVVSDIDNASDTGELDDMIDLLWEKQNALDDFEANTQPTIMYVGAVRAYTANARVVCEAIKDYIDGGEASDYDKFQEYLGKVNDLTDNAVEKRKSFLADAGFSDNEIAEFPAEIRDNTVET